MAAVCGLRSCAAGGGVYAPQLAAWRREARAFRFVTLPEDALLVRPEQALQHILRALPAAAAGAAAVASAAAAAAAAAARSAAGGRRLAASDESSFSDLQCLGSELATEVGDGARSALEGVNETLATPVRLAAHRLLRAFYAQYNAPLRSLLEALDPASTPLWRGVRWLPEVAAAAASPGGIEAISAAARALRADLVSSGEPAPDASGVGSARWLGPTPRPSVLFLGARDAGHEPMAELLLAQPGVCGGPLRLFDDESRYMMGLPAALSGAVGRGGASRGSTSRALQHAHSPAWANNGTKRAWRRQQQVRTNLTGCSLLVDTSPYLHARWTPLRVHTALRQTRSRLKLVVVLRDPTERAVRHWRGLNVVQAQARSRHSGAHSGKRTGEGARAKLDELSSYINGTNLGRKVKQEAFALGECLRARREAAGGGGGGGGSGGGGGGGGGGRRAMAEAAGLTSAEDWEACTTVACGWTECILGTGMYAPQLRGWLRYFEPRQFLLLEASRVYADPPAAAEQLRSFLGMPHFASVAPLAAANLTDLTVGEQAKRVMQRFYAEHNEQTRRLFDELAPGAAEGVSWLSGATASTGPKSRERSRHRHL